MKFKTYEIDDCKLNRNYIEYPIKITSNGVHSEKLSKEELYYLYIELNMMVQEIADMVGVKKSNVERWLKKYNIKKDLKLTAENNKKSCLEKYGVKNAGWIKTSQEKIKQTNLEKYGCEFSGGLEEFLKKAKQTNLKKYGVEYSFQSKEIKQKIKQTNLEKYGVENPMESEEIRKKGQQTKLEKYGNAYYFDKGKQKQTNLERYGVEYPQQSKEIKQKIKQTNLEKYGVEYYTQTDEYKQKIKQTNLEKYGSEYYTQTDEYKQKILKIKNEKYGRNHESQVHYSEKTYNILCSPDILKKYIAGQNIKTYTSLSNKLGITSSTLRNYAIKYDLQELFDTDINESSYEEELQVLYPFLKKHNRKLLNGKEIDLYDEEKKIGIEFNGNFWHNEYGKNKNYHQEKSKLAEEKGIFLYHIFEYEWIMKKDKIINQLNNLLGINTNKIYARKCIIKEVKNSEKKIFLENNHLQGNDSSSIKLGLYYQDELVSLMTFVKPRFNKKYEWELSRFCSKNNCNLIGGASKLFKYFIERYNPQSIISYSNIAHTKGKLYETLGFELDSISEPNYVWCRGNIILTRYQCQKHKLLEQGYEGNSESEIMHNRGYFKIYDCGNKVWIWNR